MYITKSTQTVSYQEDPWYGALLRDMGVMEINDDIPMWANAIMMKKKLSKQIQGKVL